MNAHPKIQDEIFVIFGVEKEIPAAGPESEPENPSCAITALDLDFLAWLEELL